MNEVIQLLKNHRSIRKFTEEKLSDELIQTLVGAAQSASTSSYVQAYSIIGVTDDKKKRELREVSGQFYVEENGHLFVFVIDFNRHVKLSSETNKAVAFDKTENLLVGTVDVALAAQNMAVAAESLDLGVCFLGSLRNDAGRVIEILNLPEGVFPLFGLAVGYPAQEGSVKERLPFEAIYHENEYVTADTPDINESIKQYDARISEYYKERTNNERSDTWSEQVTGMLSKKMRLDIDALLKGQGFLKQ